MNFVRAVVQVYSFTAGQPGVQALSCMIVPVMQIRSVCMFVRRPSMPMQMRMRFNHRSVVLMLVMLVMGMQMIMLENPVRVNVTVPFVNQHESTNHNYKRA